MTRIEKDRAARIMTFIIAGAFLFCAVVLLTFLVMFMGTLFMGMLTEAFLFSEQAAYVITIGLGTLCFLAAGWVICVMPDPEHDPEDPNP